MMTLNSAKLTSTQTLTKANIYLKASKAKEWKRLLVKNYESFKKNDYFLNPHLSFLNLWL